MLDFLKLITDLETTPGNRNLDAELATLCGWVNIKFTTRDINGSSVEAGFWVHKDTDPVLIAEYKETIKSEISFNIWNDQDDYPRFTTSVDAALSFVNTLLPANTCVLSADYKGVANMATWAGSYQYTKGWASLSLDDDAASNYRAYAVTQASAIVRAALMAWVGSGLAALS